jgi:CNT family concentrative nucleoside transporter
MLHLQSASGVIALLAFAYLISENRRAVDWKSVGIAFAVTVATAVLLLEVPQLKAVFALVGRAADAIGEASRAGTSFVFGYLGGGALPFDLKTIVSLGPKTIVSGTLTTCLMGAMVGVLN